MSIEVDAGQRQLVWTNAEIDIGLKRWSHAACSVKAIPNWRMFVFGGATLPSDSAQTTQHSFDAEVQVLDMSTMRISKPEVIGAPPLPRSDTPIVYDTKNSRLLVFGGWAGEWLRRLLHDGHWAHRWSPICNHGHFSVQGPITGGAKTTITGIDFVDAPNIVVRFSAGRRFEDVPAEFVNDTTLLCATPDFTHHGGDEVLVRVAMRGDAFTTTFQKYKFFSVTDATQTVMYGPGITNGSYSGIENSFYIQARDGDGVDRISSGDEFSIIVEKESGGQVPADLEYEDAGRYRVTFTADTAGAYKVSVIFEGTFDGVAGHVDGSPCSVTFAEPATGAAAENSLAGPVVRNATQLAIGNLVSFAKSTLDILKEKPPENNVEKLLTVMETVHAGGRPRERVLHYCKQLHSHAEAPSGHRICERK